jgi:hypothetical protein
MFKWEKVGLRRHDEGVLQNGWKARAAAQFFLWQLLQFWYIQCTEFYEAFTRPGITFNLLLSMFLLFYFCLFNKRT